jgi:hypothetical protein
VSAVKAILNVDALADEATQRTGLHAFGNSWFLEPLDRLLDSLRRDAGLSEAGMLRERDRIVTALANRLYMVEALRVHPEIAIEDVQVAAAVVSLPRTGSTMLHRLLAATSPFAAMRWWEVFNYAPIPGEERGHAVHRRRAGQELIDDFVRGNPDLLASHPYELDQAEEETPVLGQFFVGTLMEGFAYVPSYVDWLKTYDHREAYRELRTVMQFMQWYQPARRSQRWVLKSSAHLASLEGLTMEFPEALVIMGHRDPAQTIPSLCSLITMLHGLERGQVDKVTVGRWIAERWAWNLDRYTRVRSELSPDRFLDIDYRELTRNPLEVVRRVFARLQQPLTQDAQTSLSAWIKANRRDRRPAHSYTLGEFGLTDAWLAQRFAGYRAAHAARLS